MINLLRCEDRIKLVRTEGGPKMRLEPSSIVIPPLTLLTKAREGAGVPLHGRAITGMYDTLGSMPGTPKGPAEMSGLFGIYDKCECDL